MDFGLFNSLPEKLSWRTSGVHSGLFSSFQVLKTCLQGTGLGKNPLDCFLLVVFGKPNQEPRNLSIFARNLLSNFTGGFFPDSLPFKATKLEPSTASLWYRFSHSLCILNCEYLRHPHCSNKATSLSRFFFKQFLYS